MTIWLISLWELEKLSRKLLSRKNKDLNLFAYDKREFGPCFFLYETSSGLSEGNKHGN